MSKTTPKTDRTVSDFLERHFRHFNAAVLVDAAKSYRQHVEAGGRMFLTLAGAMSTAELGISVAELIRRDKVHAICCTGANLEEDVFNLLAHDRYERIPDYHNLTPSDEKELLNRGMNRVTDTCIPEDSMRKVESLVFEDWLEADQSGRRLFPHEFMFRLLRKSQLQSEFQIDSGNSWLYAAMEKDLPLFVPGWEDSTLGNMYAAHCVAGRIKNVHTVRTGIEYMMSLSDWYLKSSEQQSIGFFQIGGGIAGDFPICVVPMLRQDLGQSGVPLWGYYCQISDSTTSYGSYSGAHPNEKITWGKLAPETPKYVIESDASIVAPLVFAMVLGV